MRMMTLATLLIACNGNKGDTGFYIDLNPDTGKQSEPDDSDIPEPDDPGPGDSGADSGNTDSGGDTGGPNDPDIDNDGDGFTENQGDCDDANGQIYPGGIDFPTDDLDQDCSGTAAELVDVLDGLTNGNFDEEDSSNPGYPVGWINLGGAYSWQQDGENIFDENGDTGRAFIAHSSGGGAVKVWGDYGSNTISDGSHVYQEFAATEDWTPADKIFWLDAWGYHDEVDLLQGTAEAAGWIKCFDDEYNPDGASQTQRINVQTQENSWRKLSTWVRCGPDTTIVQVVLSFVQADVSTDHGAAYFDDVVFGESQ